MTTQIEKDKDIDFMLRRTLSICLTDPNKASVSGHGLTFSAARLDEVNVALTFYKPLLMLINALRMISSFRATVVRFVRLAMNHRVELASRTSKNIDWARTLENIQTGQKQTVFREAEVPWSDADDCVATLIFYEFREHCRFLLAAFEKQKLLPDSPFLKRALQLLKEFLKDTDALLVAAKDIHCLRLPWAEQVLAEPISLLKDRLVQLSDLERHGCFDIYRDQTKSLFSNLYRRVRACKGIARWREEYLSFTTGLSIGGNLHHVQTRDAAHLYEIWCFAEVANTLIQLGYENVVQCSILRSPCGGHVFKLPNDCDAYFNYYGKRSPPRSKIFAKTHVEWFIMNNTFPRQSLIIDTKYYRDWSPEEALKVLGYMNDFDVDRGAVIFRSEIPPGQFPLDKPDKRFVTRRFGASNERLFCVATLLPEESALRDNTGTLDLFVRQVILGPPP